MSRLGRLAALLDEPLLVAGLPFLVGAQANVRYLTGLKSSNSAVLVEPDGSATVYTDFRYFNRARALEGVAAVEVPRNLVAAVGEQLAGRRIAFEEQNLPYAAHRTLTDAGLDLIPAAGLVESLRAVKDDDEIATIRRAGALSDEVFEALSRERFSGRSERELAWWVERSFREAGAEGVSFEAVVAAGATASSPHAVPGDGPIATGVLVTVDAGCVIDGYCSDCTQDVRGGRGVRATPGAVCALPRGAARRARGRPPGRPRPRRRRGLARRGSRRPASAGPTVTGWATASACRSTKRRRCARSRPTSSSRGTSSPSSRGSTSPTRVPACASRISCSSPTTARERLTQFTKELLTVE